MNKKKWKEKRKKERKKERKKKITSNEQWMKQAPSLLYRRPETGARDTELARKQQSRGCCFISAREESLCLINTFQFRQTDIEEEEEEEKKRRIRERRRRRRRRSAGEHEEKKGEKKVEKKSICVTAPTTINSRLQQQEKQN